jgi:hypothetical protein
LLNRDHQEVSGEWTNDPQFALIAKDFRANALLLSLADRLAPALAKNIAVGLRRHLIPHQGSYPGFGRPGGDAAKRAWEDRAFAGWLASRLKSSDIGVMELEPEELEIRVPSWVQERERSENPEDKMLKRKSYRLRLRHGTTEKDFEVPYSRESRGTHRLVELAPLLYDLVHGTQPMAAFVDEIQESLHPTLLQAVIRDFNCDTAPAAIHGQLIFATHETALLDGEAWTAILRRDQIYLTEKDSSGAARLYSVAEFRERNNLNIRRRYLQGRYGALPSPGQFDD